jgi:hypothetical protein
MHAGSRNIEVDGIRPGMIVGIHNRLTERARTAVGGMITVKVLAVANRTAARKSAEVRLNLRIMLDFSRLQFN